MVDMGERMAKAEQRIQDHQAEIIRLRDGHHEFREQLGIVAAQIGVLSAKVDQIVASTELIAEQVANKVIADHAGEVGLRRILFQALLLALLVAGAALGLKTLPIGG